MPDLKPCKKCNWERPRKIRYGHLQGRPDTYRITCTNCSYCTKEKSSMSEAIEAWNCRAGEEEKNDSINTEIYITGESLVVDIIYHSYGTADIKFRLMFGRNLKEGADNEP